MHAGGKMENQNEGKAVSRQMPKSVITVIVSCGIFVFMLLALSVVTGTYLSIILQFIIWGSLLFFFAKGGRKSRLILIFYITITLLGVLAAVIVPSAANKEFTINLFIILLVIIAPLITALAAILKKSAVQYAGFCCPVCGSGKVKSKNLAFSRMICKSCGKEWQ